MLYVLYYRIYVLKELKLLPTVKKRDNVQGIDVAQAYACTIMSAMIVTFYMCQMVSDRVH